MNDLEMERFLRGGVLYGDDFTASQIAEWFAFEEEGYANLGAKDAASYRYEYHALNRLHGYSHLSDSSFERVLGYGSAYGEELLPIISCIESITVVDPSGSFVRESIHGVPATYVKPNPSGNLPFASDTFDLITCLGVLHHVPNVSSVVKELARVLRSGGQMLLREPIVSMGDWRYPRHGLTKHERGIPLQILEGIVRDSGLDLVRKTLYGFPVTERLFRVLRCNVYNNVVTTWIDAIAASAFAWNTNYHPRTFVDRFCPTAVFLVLRKPTNATGT